MDAKNSSKTARVARPERLQVEWQPVSLDQMLPADHRARIVWSYVKLLNLEPLYAAIEVSGNTRGRTATAPELLVALWLLATLEGIGSARELERRCESDIPFRWMCGRVSINYHTLSDFRVQHGAFLERLLVDTVASFVQSGLVPLTTIAQDGMRVKASAGSSSFRRKPTLAVLQRKAQEHVDRLRKETESDSARQAGDARRQSAKERAAREQQERIAEALKQHEALSQQREKRTKGEGEKTRVSTTDPDARNMKMANGGFNPAYNVQFATDTKHQVIVGVDVVNEGSDAGLIAPMVEQIEQRTGVRPKDVLVDGGYSSHEEIEALNDPEQGYKVYMPVKAAAKQLARGEDPYAARDDESARVTEWRKRMGTDEAQAIYKERASTAECVNALARQRGLTQFRVRGLEKVRTVALWFAVAHNVRRWAVLCAKVETAIKHV